ncbi:cobyrinate a,c-diamide synthase [Roseospirillum parvum]|uniref:Cobyrinic acid a,c-diamide synthase n=1 Tax=Roseospirillum parvum TaxID=83401 RepID=A0A1G7W245_9PROT|nr:cobyrinate a,c-diamide synthase [Roseospirillum parvum]SDG65948.1 cobyrinic acid a,c-diamide synthase [Roseospirillum parvum]
MARLFLSAAHKSSGKTTISLGLAAALTARGLVVQTFKKGPDYIDPLWLARASGRPCFNLDFNTQSRGEIGALCATHAAEAQVSLIEGNKGLFDGMALDGSDSNAALARAVAAPVVLIVDCRGMTRGIAPLLMGYRAFEPDLPIAGVILNRTGGARHEGKLIAAIEHFTDLKVLGAVREAPELAMQERHLGLIPASEAPEAAATVARIGRVVGDGVDLDALLARPAPPLPAPPPATPRPAPDLRIAIARDAAFAFTYPDDAAAFAAAGAELVPVDTLSDPALPPDIDALVLPGGFPETQAAHLAANAPLRQEIARAIAAGLPTHAECGGLMLLCRDIVWQGERFPMAGVIPASAVMHPRPQGHGLARLRPTAQALWSPLAPDAEPDSLPAHEFHHSSLREIDPTFTPRFAFEVARGTGIDGAHDGLVVHNTTATYCHLRQAGPVRWVDAFVAFARSRRG